MQQTKKVVINTIERQQEDLLKKLYKEKEDLEIALADKEEQIRLQEEVLATIKGE